MPEQQNIEFVITVPDRHEGSLAYDAKARMTEGVLVGLIAQAKDSLVIAAPYFRPAQTVEKGNIRIALEAALQRGVDVDIASQSSKINDLNKDSLRAVAAGRLRFFTPAANVKDGSILGSHAKFYISDNRSVYLGSANFTRSGLWKHLEMGVLVEGKVAMQVKQFWEHLIKIGFFQEVEKQNHSF